ncbi:hypothetical protein GLOIN_2v1729985 [Rhizophagus clarus]|uniref:Uncharacterized protein n=1 Tax=Rhizophagus clarus TaxID=94130 RepID=A0A8H3LRN0_9GLOM|nr:hypothetical protein GLOIN_2v1729985 [Rhizophagus clarus]
MSLSNQKTVNLDLLPKSIAVVSPNTKNKLIVCRTGSGRSALANVRAGSEDFRENTVELKDTNLSLKQVLYKIVDGSYSILEVVGQVY